MAYPWPGNVRELINKIKYAIAVARGPLIETDDLFTRYDEADLKSFKKAKDEAVRLFERQYLTTLMRAFDGSVADAADVAGVNRTNLYALLRRNKIDPGASKTDGSDLGNQ